MSSLLSADDLNDFIRPSVACIKPIEDLRNKSNELEHFTLEIEREEDEYNNNNQDIEIDIDMNGDVIEIDKGNDNNKRKLEKAQISLTDCLACSGCITSSEEVLISQHSFKEFINFWNENKYNKDIHFILNLSQQSRTSLANAFNTEIYIIDQIICEIFNKYYGFEYIISSNIGRELSYIGLYDEIINNKREQNNENDKCLLSSICPGWVLYIEKTHFEILNKLSKVKSPQFITSKLIKDLMKKQYGIEYSNIYNLSIMPCFDKKLEASRDSDIVNCVITPKELISMIEEDNRINIEEMINLYNKNENEKEKEIERAEKIADYIKMIERFTPKGWFNGFNNNYGWFNKDEGFKKFDESGGYAIKYIEYFIKRNQLKEQEFEININQGRNEDIYEIQLINKINKEIICRSGVINGFKNIQNLVRKLKDNKDINKKRGKNLLISRRRGNKNSNKENNIIDLSKCEFVEVMACPNGCINGGGQISAPTGIDSKEWIRMMKEKYHSMIMNRYGCDDDDNDNDNIEDNINQMVEWVNSISSFQDTVFDSSNKINKIAPGHVQEKDNNGNNFENENIFAGTVW